jgi:hypothetical protein
MTERDYGLARRMWHQLEPVHAVFWYAPEVSEEAAGLGYEVATRWPSYFAWCRSPPSAPEEVFASRGQGAANWAAARDRLAARGWIDAAGQATAGTAGTRSNGVPTGSPTRPGKRSAPTAPSGSPNSPGPSSAPPSNPACSPPGRPWAWPPCERPPAAPELARLRCARHHAPRQAGQPLGESA